MKAKQHTLAQVTKITGIAALSGKEVSVEIHPSGIDSGTSFEIVMNGRNDLIPVAIDNIVETENHTTLCDRNNPSIQIHFVEHILGTLHGLGIDNCIIKASYTEIPLFDGSALPFIEAINQVGIVEQDSPRREIIITQPIFIDEKALLMALPYDGLKLTYFLDQTDIAIGKQLADIDVNTQTFTEKIGLARTFIEAERLSELLSSGLIKNTDMRQAIIVDKTGPNQPLRFSDEYCCHKMLDLLGDLFLCGRRLRGHFIGIKSGHFQNRKLIRQIAGIYLNE